MPSSPLSLNEDILSEILRLLLLDSPREPNRISILRSCRFLRRLGLPHLYRTIDLTGYRTRNVVLKHWKTLFGEGGVLTVKNERREERVDVGSFVRELKLGAKSKASLAIFDSDPVSGDFEIPPLNLPNCTSLLVDGTSLFAGSYPPISAILSRLPVLDFTFRYDWDGDQEQDEDENETLDAFPLNTFGESTPGEVVLGLHASPWENLQTFTFQGTVWYDEVEAGYSKLSFADWSFETLVLEVALIGGREVTERDGLLARLLLDEVKDGRFLEGVKRVEFRTDAKVEGELKEAVEKRVMGQGGLSEHERRIVSLIVFVDGDGKERGLLEEWDGC